jgi:PAS domain S-box-containing protein
MMEDMTDYNSLKSELERSNQMLKTIIDNIPSMIWLKDVDGRYLFTNKSFNEFNQFTNTDPIGKTDYELWPKPQADAFTAEDISVRECEYPLEKTDAIIHPVYGPKHYHTVKVGVCDDKNQLVGTIGISCDVTNRVERDKILAEAIDTLTSSLNGNTYVKS